MTGDQYKDAVGALAKSTEMPPERAARIERDLLQACLRGTPWRAGSCRPPLGARRMAAVACCRGYPGHGRRRLRGPADHNRRYAESRNGGGSAARVHCRVAGFSGSCRSCAIDAGVSPLNLDTSRFAGSRTTRRFACRPAVWVCCVAGNGGAAAIREWHDCARRVAGRIPAGLRGRYLTRGE